MTLSLEAFSEQKTPTKEKGCEKISPLKEQDGTEDRPHIISNLKDFKKVRKHAGKDQHFVVADNIDLEGAEFEPISLSQGSVFDGRRCVISNLKIDKPETKRVGFFAFSKGIVKNVVLENVKIVGKQSVGGLVGLNNYGKISNSYATGEVNGNGGYPSSVGGLVGENYYGEISKSYAIVKVKGDSEDSVFVGGFVGRNSGKILNSYATGEEVKGRQSVGGFVGYNTGKILNSYATVKVKGDSVATGEAENSVFVGGLVGSNHAGGEISNSYATGDIEGYMFVDGLVGLNYGKISNSYGDANDTEIEKATQGWSREIWDFNVGFSHPQIKMD